MAVNLNKLKVLIRRLGNAAQAGVLVMREHRDRKTSGNYAKGWRQRCQPLVPSRRLIAAAVLTCLLYMPKQSYSECKSNHEQRVEQELSALGERGDAIARAREQVLQILKSENACSAWFQETNSDPAEVFRSVHFELEHGATSNAYSLLDRNRGQLFKHPWAARTTQNAGRNAVVQLNGNGPFFKRTSLIMQLDPSGKFAQPSGNLVLTVSSYLGNTPEAQITILLHELGHIIGRLQEDDDSWDGRSFRNTSEVSQHCKAETRAAAHSSPRGST